MKFATKPTPTSP